MAGDGPQGAEETVVLRLYVSGLTPRARSVQHQLEQALARLTRIKVDFQVIDISATPEVAETKNILATPTLERESPPPSTRLLGDVSDIDRVMNELGLAEFWDFATRPKEDRRDLI